MTFFLNNEDIFDIVFEYASVQNSMGTKVENKLIDKFDADLMFIDEWIEK